MSKIDDYEVIGTRVIVEVEKLKAGTIHLVEDYAKREQDRITKGIYVKGGPVAFSDQLDLNKPIDGQIPKKGDMVYFVKFAGKGLSLDDNEYRVIQDEDIYAYEKQDKDDE